MLDFDIVYSDMSEFDNFHPSPSTRLRSLFTLMPPITDVTHRAISSLFTLITYNRRATPLYGIVRAI